MGDTGRSLEQHKAAQGHTRRVADIGGPPDTFLLMTNVSVEECILVSKSGLG
jgi:hypothetical protein